MIEEKLVQQRLHEAIEEALEGIEQEGILTGWVVAFETTPLDAEERAQAGHLYGPPGMTSWRALGLVEWAKFGLAPEDDDDEA